MRFKTLLLLLSPLCSYAQTVSLENAINIAHTQSVEAKEGQFHGENAGDIRNDLLYIGNLDEGCQFNITMSLLNDNAEIKYDEAIQQAYKEDKGMFPDAEEFADSVGTVSIIIE